ncbi:hypothetical protein [Peribacillus loiseleuriae]|uniref:Uncharacterized protein n=1 Tax=Peribacillus loiseleuriae TaxID=1679170 RepID=A0A0K9GTP8_9BACI|nr:hypothetical protein [Peribacillus loiseleuriae]KMY50059.1 hypothetical protein AC625_11515 [Peribacillus loiseleuriae]
MLAQRRIKNDEDKEEITQGIINENENTNQKVVDTNDKNTLLEFETMALPTIKIMTSEGTNNFVFDHSYAEVCWMDCDEWNTYNYPEIHSGDVEIGDKLQIDWKMIEPYPTEINLIHIDSETHKEITKEKKDTNISPFTITIDEKMIENQYALEFLWQNGEVIEGRSMLDFKLK